MDPHFVAQSAPGIESVDPIDPTHFKVISGFGVGSIKVRFAMDVELFDVVDRESAKMRVRGKAPGSAIDVVSSMQIADAGSSGSQLNWSATSEVSGTVASVGARLMAGTARKLTEQFWTDFARRVSQEGR
jgi:carbon monoxide dehydrogenase subunit G